ncbi:phage integrase SAM-like domain-containing protein [Dinghuibacter silviterrae]|uniref:Integrase-like protein n=1 Tax=Dinghuibacter silviterrae TaxID=1539049 RepID=A0A4R8DH76_9BACT|nr:phage integrase SAM-like domain-containing protein [Dinghuibacter silviterrae]TDW97061.1 integrase-like protein [Dinghuibacter silviterrae]
MYVKQSISIRFYRSLKRENSKGLVPLYVKLTIDGLVDEISTSVFIHPEHWDQEEQVITDADPQADTKNKVLSNMTTDLNRHFDLIQAKEGVATPALVFKAYKTPIQAEKRKEEQLENLAFSEALDDLVRRYVIFCKKDEKARDQAMPIHTIKAELLEKEKEALKKELEKIKKRGNKIFDDADWEKTMILAVDEHLVNFFDLSFSENRSYTTLERMWGRKRRYVEFLKYRHDTIDMPLDKVQFKMADQLLIYNITQYDMNDNSSMKYVQNLKEVLTRATSQGWVSANVFDAFQCHYDETDRKWPTPTMLEDFRTHVFKNDLQNRVRDCYIAGCYTGYAYAELYSFKPDEIVDGIDGKRWSGKNRRKTGVEETLPLLPVVRDLIEKYKDHPLCVKRGSCLPIPSNIVYNRELKRMEKQMGWNIKLDGHTSRYYFVNEVAFNNGITSLKTLMKIMGIKSIKTLMIYLKGNKNAISEGMQMVEEKLFNADGTFRSSISTTSKEEPAKIIRLYAV